MKVYMVMIADEEDNYTYEKVFDSYDKAKAYIKTKPKWKQCWNADWDRDYYSIQEEEIE